MAVSLRRRSITRLVYITTAILLAWFFLGPSSNQSRQVKSEEDYKIREHNFIERATRPDKSLNVQRHPFLQARMGRDERDDVFNDLIFNGAQDYWERFQLPYIVNKETSGIDMQHVLSAIDQLLALNGWVGHLCPTLTRPFGQHKRHNAYEDIIREDRLYYIAIIIHSADHFLVDQLATIVQLAKRFGTNNLFVSMLDYDSKDSTETLLDLSEAVLTLLGIPFRIRRVAPMTEDPNAAYYPLEEAHTRNLALEPLHELHSKRQITFSRVLWLKGFTCPNDILETIKISYVNEAAMVCGMDWAEHNGFFIFSDRWRTRDIQGDQFRQSKSSSKPDAVPPRDKTGAMRYNKHLPFQVFCCESGTHVVDPAQSYYRGIQYRAGPDYLNVSRAEGSGKAKLNGGRDPDAPCLDSSQAWFCRDLWVRSAKDGITEAEGTLNRRSVVEWAGFDRLMDRARSVKRSLLPRDEPGVDGRDAVKVQVGATEEEEVADNGKEPVKVQVGTTEEEEISDDAADARKKPAQKVDADANAGSDYDAMPEADEGDSLSSDEEDDKIKLPEKPMKDLPDGGWVEGAGKRPNSVYRPARILVNPRCPTTYAGVSHTKLARDLFGEGEDEEDAGGKYVLDDWEGAPESFVCQEQRTTGGRKAAKTQRRLEFSIHDELEKLSTL